jgi:hypothetical protein
MDLDHRRRQESLDLAHARTQALALRHRKRFEERSGEIVAPAVEQRTFPDAGGGEWAVRTRRSRSLRLTTTWPAPSSSRSSRLR